MTILIADDEAASRCMLKMILEKEGHQVVEYNNGTDALQALKEWDAPQFAILDWVMPGMDGVDIIRELRRTNSGKRVYTITLTYKQGKVNLVEALKNGADDYISKPFDRDELLARVNVGIRIVELQTMLSEKIVELENALDQIKTLHGMIPICSWCKKIRDDAGYWQQVEKYLNKHNDAVFTHGICPECYAKQVGKMDDE